MVIGNLLAVQNFTGHENAFNWYISAIFLLYLLAPYFMLVAKHQSSFRKVLFLIFLLVFTIPFWRAGTYIITITRLPIFYLGMIFAQMCRANKKLSRKDIIGLIVAFVLGVVSILAFKKFASSYLWSYGLYWYPFILITPPLCIAVSCISMLLEKTKVTGYIISFLSLCGDYSFEMYLIHILLIECVSIAINIFGLSQISYLIWILGGVFLFVGCFMLRYITATLSRLFVKYCSKCS
jgi:peptidoglycan/LPS O-acetylase OafA/YrhL